jgi:hypothetical protein
MWQYVPKNRQARSLHCCGGKIANWTRCACLGKINLIVLASGTGLILKGERHGKNSAYRFNCFNYADDLEPYCLPSFKEQEICKDLFWERDGPNSMVTVVTCNNWLVPPQCSDFILV